MVVCILACGKWPGYEGRRGWSAQCTLVLLYAVSHRDQWMLSVSITCSDLTKKMITTALHFSTLQKPRTFIVIEELKMSFEPQRVSKVNSQLSMGNELDSWDFSSDSGPAVLMCRHKVLTFSLKGISFVKHGRCFPDIFKQNMVNSLY